MLGSTNVTSPEHQIAVWSATVKVEVQFEGTRRNDLIQTFRALQAVAESGIVVVVPDDEADRWRYAATWFPFDFRVGSDAPRVPISIDHQTPSVTIGRLARPLLFPHRALDLYREAWSDRTIRASFAGKFSHQRRKSLRTWAKANAIRLGRGTRRGSEGILVRSAESGRVWPGKAWDSAYVNELGSSQFVLCPDGGSVWTYRFFEAAAAGAIPIVENMSPLYEGFVFGTLADPFDALRWSAEAAEANYVRAHEMLTAPHEEIRTAIETLLGNS